MKREVEKFLETTTDIASLTGHRESNDLGSMEYNQPPEQATYWVFKLIYRGCRFGTASVRFNWNLPNHGSKLLIVTERALTTYHSEKALRSPGRVD